MKSFFIQTLGCQMNEYDSGRLAQSLLDAGWRAAADESEADLLLVNTCTVRQLAEHKAFSLIGRWAKLKQARPDLIIGMVGCLAQHLAEKAFTKAPQLDFLAGPRALTRVPELAAEQTGRKLASFEDSGYGAGIGSAAVSGICATVGIMEGCEQFCSYCAVPLARGREASRPVADILGEIGRRLARGAKEIVLLGQNVNHYGRDLPDGLEFADLLRQAAQMPGLLRLRFMTSHPVGFPPNLIAAMAALPAVCESLHLPLQSGSDRILAAMDRGYTRGEYLALLERLRAAIPGITFSTDLIVGFPGETEADFQRTLDTYAEAGFETAYCFQYSPRPGTAAENLPDPVPPELARERLVKLLEFIRRQGLATYTPLVGTQDRVLVEAEDAKHPGRLKGHTRTNRPVTLSGPRAWLGSEIDVRFVAASAWVLSGERIGAGE